MIHWYRVTAVLGHGGFGLTYLAADTNLNQYVAIKEYLPGNIATRNDASTVRPLTDQHEPLFTWGLDRFIKEARTLVQFKHPNIVRVMSVFEANNTAYMVMEYERGRDLDKLIRIGNFSSETEYKAIVYPILDGLQLVHHAGFIHRDIKPGNIYIREDGSSVLLDFGSARQSVENQTHAITSLYTPGFAPFEQYHDAEGQQGPWSDVYSIGALLYLLVTGQRPVDAMKRSAALINKSKDPYIPVSELAHGSFSSAFLDGIDQALSFKEQDRPQDVQTLKRLLEGDKSSASSNKLTNFSQSGTQQNKLWNGWRAVVVVFLFTTVIGMGVFYGWQDNIYRQQDQEASRASPKQSPREVKVDRAQQDAIDQLLAKADVDRMAGRLIAPKQKNALDRYREVLELDKQNAQAISGIEQITSLVVNQIRRVISSGQYDRAEGAIAVAEQTIGAIPAVVGLKQQCEVAKKEADEKLLATQLAQAEKIKQAKEKASRLKLVVQQQLQVQQQGGQEVAEAKKYKRQVSRLLAQAKVDIADGRLANTPQGNDALSRYQQILVIDPVNEAAHQGIAQLGEKLAGMIKTSNQRSTKRKTSVPSVPVALVAYGQTVNEVNRELYPRMIEVMKQSIAQSLNSDVVVEYKRTVSNYDFFDETRTRKISEKICTKSGVKMIFAVLFEQTSFERIMNSTADFYVAHYTCETKAFNVKSSSVRKPGADAEGPWDSTWTGPIEKYLDTNQPFSGV